MSLVIQNIDPPPRSPPGECVLPHNKGGGGGGYTLAGRKEGWEVNILEDERHRIALLYSNNLSTVWCKHVSLNREGRDYRNGTKMD
jgi:hypothetical protein